MLAPTCWNALRRGDFKQATAVELSGYITVAELAVKHRYFLLTPDPACCLGCIPRSSDDCIEVFMREELGATDQEIGLRGALNVLQDDACGWHYQLLDATLSWIAPREEDGAALRLGRRRFLSGSALLGLAACASAPPPPQAMSTKALSGREILELNQTVDMHSHAGRVIPLRTVQNTALADQRSFEPLGAPMRQGNLSIVCLAVVADTPVTQVIGERIEANRDPAPGELYTWALMAFERAHRLIDSQGLATITDVVSLRAARGITPAAIVAAEGGDFLEGRIDRVDEFYQRHQLRHLQLTHYRVNELGDIQTEPEQHGGLTDFGVQVIKRCNRIGMVVDVAHGPYDLVKRAAEVTDKPLVLSHTSLSLNPGPRSRLISPEHAKLVAGTGGVIGIWPPSSRFPDLHAMAEGMARMVDVVGGRSRRTWQRHAGLDQPFGAAKLRRLADARAGIGVGRLSARGNQQNPRGQLHPGVCRDGRIGVRLKARSDGAIIVARALKPGPKTKETDHVTARHER